MAWVKPSLFLLSTRFNYRTESPLQNPGIGFSWDTGLLTYNWGIPSGALLKKKKKYGPPSQFSSPKALDARGVLTTKTQLCLVPLTSLTKAHPPLQPCHYEGFSFTAIVTSATDMDSKTSVVAYPQVKVGSLPYISAIHKVLVHSIHFKFH